MRQQVLFLYLQSSALDSQVVAWSSYDGTSEGPTPPVESRPTAPYRTGVDALRDDARVRLPGDPVMPKPEPVTPGT